MAGASTQTAGTENGSLCSHTRVSPPELDSLEATLMSIRCAIIRMKPSYNTTVARLFALAAVLTSGLFSMQTCTTNYGQSQAFRHDSSPSPVTGGTGGGGGGIGSGGSSINSLQQQYPDLYDENLPYNGLFYGLPFSAEMIHPVSVGKVGNKVSMRFRPEKSGLITKVSFNNRVNRRKQTAYSSGDGGRVHAELRTDDGSAKHLPTDTVLGKTNSYIPAEGDYPMMTLTFDKPVKVESGKLYHMVFVQNESEHFSINGMSIIGLIDPLGGPYYGNDFFMLTKDGAAWKRGSFQAAFPKYVMSYMSLGYSDGTWIGHGGGWSMSPARNSAVIGGSNRARQVFTVEGPTRRVNGVWFRPVRQSSGVTAPLVLEIKNASGDVLLRHHIPASEVSVGNLREKHSHASPPIQWVYVDFPSVVSLVSDSKYVVELSSQEERAYKMQAYLDLVEWRYIRDRNMWSNAQAEISEDDGKSWSDRITQRRLDFGFGFTLEGGPKSIRSMGGKESIIGL